MVSDILEGKDTGNLSMHGSTSRHTQHVHHAFCI